MLQRRALHEQIADTLRREIRTRRRPGDRLSAESALARRFGVSVVTVREALLRLSQEGLIERRHGSGTYVRDPQGPKTVALLVDRSLFVGRGAFFFLYVARRLRELLAAHDVQTRMVLGQFEAEAEATGPESQAFLAQLEAGQIHAAVAIALNPPEPWRDAFRRLAIPLLTQAPGGDLAVSSDLAGMMRQAVEVLAARGRRRIALVDSVRGPHEHDPFAAPFRTALRAAGAVHRPEWRFGSLSPVRVGSDFPRFAEFWRRPGPKPDGLVVCDDHLYGDAAPALLALGIAVPRNLLVVTHANRSSDVAYPFPTVRLEYDPEAHAAAVVDLLLQALEHRQSARREVVLGHQVVGLEAIDRLLHAPATQPSRR